MARKIVFLDEYSLAGADLSPIRSLGDYTGYDFTRPEQVVDRCRDAQTIITNKIAFDRQTMQQLPCLKLICVAATGMNHIDLAAAAQLGIEVRNAAGYSTHSVAETTLGAAIALLRHSVYYDAYIKSGDYSRSERHYHYRYTNRQLYGKHWGIVGLGAIGHEVARLAEAFGCRVRYTSVSGVERPEPYAAAPLGELLDWADVVSIHCPLNDRTRGLIGSAQLERMKSSAILINVARGGIVDEQALARSIDEGTIAGAALDVFTSEPLQASNPLLRVQEKERLLLSPHNAWSPEEAVAVLVEMIATNIRDFYRAER